MLFLFLFIISNTHCVVFICFKAIWLYTGCNKIQYSKLQGRFRVCVKFLSILQQFPHRLTNRYESCDVGEAKEGLENELWRRWINGRAGEWAVTWVKRRMGWRMSCDVGQASEGLEKELWRRWSFGRVGQWAVSWVKQRKGWRMSCDVGKATEGLENELWRRWSNGRVGERAVTWVKRQKGWRMSCDVGEVTKRLENEHSYIQCYIQWSRAHSPTFPSLHLRHNSFSNTSVALPTSQLIL